MPAASRGVLGWQSIGNFGQFQPLAPWWPHPCGGQLWERQPTFLLQLEGAKVDNKDLVFHISGLHSDGGCCSDRRAAEWKQAALF